MKLSKREMLAVATLGAAGAATAGDAAAQTGRDWRPDDEVSFRVWSEINAATQGYADCLDRFDMAGLAALFSPDCVYDYAPGLMMRGRDEVVAGARKSLAAVARSSHFVGPPVVTVGPARGTYASVVYFSAVHEQKDGGHHTVWGRYIDLFAPDDAGALLISHRQTLGHLAEGTSAPRRWLERAPS